METTKTPVVIFHLVRNVDLQYTFKDQDTLTYEIVKSSFNRDVLQKILDETPELGVDSDGEGDEEDPLTDENHSDLMLSPTLTIIEGELI